MSDKMFKPVKLWGVLIGDSLLLKILAVTRAEARGILAGRRRLEKLRPELCPEKGRSRVVRVSVQIEEGLP
jgi:hypothetical protein